MVIHNHIAMEDMNSRITNLEPAPFWRRAAAYAIDILLIYVYAIALFGVSMAVETVMPFQHMMAESYLLRHGIAFFSLSLPVLVWFWRWEAGPHRATPGKRVMKIRVQTTGSGKIESKQVLIRNILKFLPWEWAHTFLHIHPDFLMGGEVATLPTVIGMYLPQVMVLGYALTVAIRKDGMAPYDLISGTRIESSRTGHPATKVAVGLFLLCLTGVSFAAAQNRPDQAQAYLSFDQHTVQSGPLALRQAIGFGGGVVVDGWVLGGQGRVYLPQGNVDGRLQSGTASVYVGHLVARKGGFQIYPTMGLGMQGWRLNPPSGDPLHRLDIVGRIALHADQSLSGPHAKGAPRLGAFVGWNPALIKGDWSDAGARAAERSSWSIGLQIGVGVGR